jgi:xyloglucan-specific exo-beta-1,4-glucanase
LVYSRDWGQTWKPCSGVSGHVRITADRVNPDKFYAFDNSTIYLSTDKGEHFIPVKTGIDTEGYFVRIQAVFGHEGDIWIAGGNRLYHSSNSGFDVRQIEHVEKVYAVGFGKAAPETDYPAIYLIGMVDGKYGVFRSTDKANSWIRINDDQHQYGSMDYVAGDELVYGRVYIGTHGRGIIYGDPL